MSTQNMPPAVGERLPNSALTSSGGQQSTLHGEISAPITIVYFMRTANCPICNAHLRKLSTEARAGAYLDARILVIVPGDASDATKVEARHPDAPLSIRASQTAHAEAGLFVKVGFQQSGTFVVDAAATIALSRVSTVPVGGFDHAAVALVIAEPASPPRT